MAGVKHETHTKDRPQHRALPGKAGYRDSRGRRWSGEEMKTLAKIIAAVLSKLTGGANTK